ncbi:hypothetical protein ACEYW6_02595 [Nostoc sp. UIC 10607]
MGGSEEWSTCCVAIAKAEFDIFIRKMPKTLEEQARSAVFRTSGKG